jgi:TRAP-type C4-dicarboxylate transport system permease small subunit
MKWIYRAENALTKSLESIVTLFFFVMVVLILLLVILRYVFITTIIGGDEATQFLFIYTTAFGASILLGKNQHIRISILLERLPQRVQKIVSILNSILIIFLHGYLLFLSIKWISSVGYFESPVLQIPQGIVQICIPISCVIIILYGLRHIVSELSGIEKETYPE